jgi:hypothetical protein
VTVHIDRAHHHPRVYKRLGYWQAKCPRCGLLWVDAPLTRLGMFPTWHSAFIAALCHATKEHS